MITEQYFIGIDNTDGPGCEGTGALVRALAAAIDEAGWGQSMGVTRHELLQSDKITYTNENFTYAMGLQTDRDPMDLEDYLVDYVREHASREADPGVAILSRHSDMDHILSFGRRSQQEVMRHDWALQFSQEGNVALRGLGAKRLGMTGALAAAGLRAGGQDGRFIDWPGLRDLPTRLTAGQIRERTGIEQIYDQENEPLDRDDMVETLDWLRPRVEIGKPVIRTQRSTEPGVGRLWVVVDRRPTSEPAGD